MNKRKLRAMYRKYLFSYSFEAVPVRVSNPNTLFVQSGSGQRQAVIEAFGKNELRQT
jgi:hypothetical protein